MKNRMVILGTSLFLLTLLLLKNVGGQGFVFGDQKVKEKEAAVQCFIDNSEFYTEDISEQDENHPESCLQLLFTTDVSGNIPIFRKSPIKKHTLFLHNNAQVLFETDASPPLYS